MTFGGIITAMVTPFDADGAVDEDATAALVHHLVESGSDGVVMASTTGEASTLSDDEKLRLFEIGSQEAGDATVIANTGSNDTRHSVELTERAAATGVDGVMAVTPYYNKPNRRGIVGHFRAVAAATDLPVVVYNIPQRCVIDLDNELLAELAEIDNVVAVKQARETDLEAVDGLDLLAGNDDLLGRVLDLGGTGGILVASQVAGHAMRRILDEPDQRAEIERDLAPLYEALAIAPASVTAKAALDLLGHRVGGVRLPLADADEDERATVREGLAAQGLLAARV